MVEENEVDDEEHEFDPEHEETIRSKWLMDGATTLSGAADKLRKAADDLVALETDGWQLIEPIADDYGHIEKE